MAEPGGCVQCERLERENEVLRSFLSDELLRRLAVQHGWPHDPDNSLGRWCCDEHQSAFYDTFLGAQTDRQEAVDDAISARQMRSDMGHHGGTYGPA